MSKVIFSIFCLFGFLLNLQCSAEITQGQNGKLYVSPGSIYVAPNAIYLNLDGDLMPVEGIRIDEKGIYIEGLMTACMTYCAACGRKL